MRLILAVLGLVAVSAAVEVPTLRYHQDIGIPEAARMKAEEEKYFVERFGGNPTNGATRIVGGAIAPVSSHPYLGGLLINFVNIPDTSVCASSLLTINRLVTAAHCWFDGWNQASQFEVVLGTNSLFNGGNRIVTNTVIMHPQWNASTLVSDIAIIYLPRVVFYTNAIQPIDLPSTQQLSESFNGLWATAAGYGRTTDQQVGASTDISQVDLQVISVAQCQAVFGFWAQESNICTNGAGGVGICRGDSGGPLVANVDGHKILIGVSSFVAEAGCQLGFPSAFTRITSFYSFITQNLD